MDFALKKLNLQQATKTAAGVLIVLVGKDALDKTTQQSADALSKLLEKAKAAGDFDGSAGQLLQAYAHQGVQANRIIFAGVGDAKPRHLAKAVSAALSACKAPTPRAGEGQRQSKRLPALVLWHPAVCATPEALQAVMYASAASLYTYTATKSKATLPALDCVMLGLPETLGLQAAFDETLACIAGVEFAKEWGNRPANHATPTMLAQAAKALAAGSASVQCEVLGPKQVAKLKMGSFMAVAQGSSEPLRFIVLRYQGAAKSTQPTVLVGKGITFDTGGISIKPAAEMDEMKFDMCGAASVLGVFKALSILQPKLHVVGLIPSCENMPSGKAVKPGDVVTSMSGQTIEILNTDAEGRLILCDALTYAERFQPAAVVDIATLTGACMVALGGVRSGLFSTDESLASQLLAAGEAVQDLAWRMPLDEDYAEGLKTNFADVANVAGRMGGAIVAARFLARFASQYPWAHLDIAGTAWKSGTAKGATGRPVALLMKYLLGLQSQSQPSGAKQVRSRK